MIPSYIVRICNIDIHRDCKDKYKFLKLYFVVKIFL